MLNLFTLLTSRKEIPNGWGRIQYIHYSMPSTKCDSIWPSTRVSFTLEFTTWAWVQATAETAFGSGLVVRSPGSVKALNQSTHNSLGHCQNVHLAVAGHCRKFILPLPATAEWTFWQWPRELWVDWFNALIKPGIGLLGHRRMPFRRWSELKLRWWTQTLPRLYRIHLHVPCNHQRWGSTCKRFDTNLSKGSKGI